MIEYPVKETSNIRKQNKHLFLFPRMQLSIYSHKGWLVMERGGDEGDWRRESPGHLIYTVVNAPLNEF